MKSKEGIFGKITTRDYRLAMVVMGFTALLLESLPSDSARGIIAIALFTLAIIVIINQMNRIEKDTNSDT